jgi:hypothetical protein
MTNTHTVNTLAPETTKRGDIVAYTDKRGRACTAEVFNVFPGMVVCYVRSVEGLTKRDLWSFSAKQFPWADGRIRRGDEMPGHKYRPSGS